MRDFTVCLSVHLSNLRSTSRWNSIFLARTSLHHRVTSLKGCASQHSAFRIRRIPHVLCVYFYVAKEEGTLCLAYEVHLSDVHFTSVQGHCPLFVTHEDLVRRQRMWVRIYGTSQNISSWSLCSQQFTYAARTMKINTFRHTWPDLWTQRSALKIETLSRSAIVHKALIYGQLGI